MSAALNSAAARARLSRQRKKRGDVALLLELPSATLGDLVALGWLASDMRGDSSAVLEAFCQFCGRALALKIRRETIVEKAA